MVDETTIMFVFVSLKSVGNIEYITIVEYIYRSRAPDITWARPYRVTEIVLVGIGVECLDMYVSVWLSRGWL